MSAWLAWIKVRHSDELCLPEFLQSRIDGRLLYIKAVNMAGWADLFGEEHGIVTVAYRRINGNIAGVENVPD